ncbi:dehydration-responsive element-binding protein 1F-like [Asparagus officinalis]|nr:dehydration-responsive element-binding protein 1F-like [Asparagus officinalis]XP_020263258.1 dehydration-responsive element-binding protein 1F-like [Asparagus officinalis]XP_020270956.1 dehydration-responsive element-binding protein 1F-like [Asparagus officinalis]
MAARAHDVAAIALRGKSAPLNFEDSAWMLPRVASSSAEEIRRVASEAAERFRPVVSSPRQPMPSPSTLSSRPPPAVFVDEEALFNMSGLLKEMAEGLMLTPPEMGEREREE